MTLINLAAKGLRVRLGERVKGEAGTLTLLY